jgi:hypothetical protein
MLQEVELKEAVSNTSKLRVTESGLVKGVHLLGYKSKNKKNGEFYSYAKEAVISAAPAYVGLPIFLDHNEEGGRKFVDQIGIVKETSVVDVGMIGDIQFNTEHPFYAATKWWIENRTETVGFSHDVIAKFDTSLNSYVEIVKPKSVDLVVDPATTKGFAYRATEGVVQDKLDERRVQDIFSAINELYYMAYYNSKTPLTQPDFALKLIPVLQDGIVELNSVANKPNVQKESDMDLTKLALEELKSARPDLVAMIAKESVDAENAVLAKINDATKDLPASAKSKVFMDLVTENIRAGKDVAGIVADRKELVSVTESAKNEQPQTTGAKKVDKTEAVKESTKVDLSDDSILSMVNKR